MSMTVKIERKKCVEAEQPSIVDLAERNKQLADYLEGAYKRRPPVNHEGMALRRQFPIDKRPLDLKNLRKENRM